MVKSFIAKKKSKRLTCRRKHKIEKKIREHNRKVRKDTKEKQKAGKSSGHRKKQEIQVPNKCPFKDEILLQAQENKRIEEEAKIKRREEIIKRRKEAKEKLIKEKRKQETSKLGDLIENAQQRQAAFENKVSIENEGAGSSLVVEKGSKAADNSLKTYYAEVKKVIERADVLIQVLDARDPLGCRSSDLEKVIVENGKRLVLLLNKIDLIPKNNVLAWLKYLRNEFPTVAFKASTQAQNTNLGRAGHSLLSSSTSKCIGADLLMKLLGNYCRNKDIKTSICVGIIGFPNVGKSSVINSLKRKAACGVGAMPGITKNVQEVHLDKKVRLIDSPGVALCQKDAYDRIEMALKNVIRVDLLEDPVAPVEAILRRCTKDSLMLQYKISDFQNVDEFLSQVALKIGRLKKGGVPDRRMAAKRVLHDWNTGKIRYYTVPPENSSGVQIISSELVNEMSKEFDFDSLNDEEKLLVDDLPDLPQPDSIVLPAWKDVVKIDTSNLSNSNTTNNEMEVEASKSKIRGILKNSSNNQIQTDSLTGEEKLAGNLKLNVANKMRFKKDKKKRKRADKLATNLSDVFVNAMEIGEPSSKNDAYNFDDHFK